MLFMIPNQMTIKVLICSFRQKHTKGGDKKRILRYNYKGTTIYWLTFFGNTDLEEKLCLIKPV